MKERIRDIIIVSFVIFAQLVGLFFTLLAVFMLYGNVALGYPLDPSFWIAHSAVGTVVGIGILSIFDVLD